MTTFLQVNKKIVFVALSLLLIACAATVAIELIYARSFGHAQHG